MPFLSLVKLYHFLSVNRKFLVRIDHNAKQPRVSLLSSFFGCCHCQFVVHCVKREDIYARDENESRDRK